MLEWLSDNETLAWWLAAVSMVTFVATLIAVPVIVVRLPADYFATDQRPSLMSFERRPILRVVWQTGKTLLGLALIITGLLMLVLPGQGVVTILVGVMLLKFPRKHELERWIISRKQVLGSINWLRRRYHRPPLNIQPATDKRS